MTGTEFVCPARKRHVLSSQGYPIRGFMHEERVPRVGLIGCGYWGKNLARNFSQLGALELVCDFQPEGLKTAREIAPSATLTDSFEQALKADLDGLVIATPAETHFELAQAGLLAGKDILVEKPLALQYSQGRRLVETATERQRMLMVGHVLEYHPGIRRLIELVRSGQLGRLQYVYSNRLSLGKIRREENILWSFAPHDIAVILRLVQELPLQLIASGGNYVQANIADVTVTHLLFNNGVRAHIHVSWLHPFKEQRLVVIGSHRMASFDDVHKKLVLYDQRVAWEEGNPLPVRGEGEEIDYPATEPLRLECEAFLDAIRTRRGPLTDGPSALNVLRVLNAAQRSLIMNGQPITFAQETFEV